MTTKTFKKLPGTLAFQRGFVISDALFYNLTGERESPLYVFRHGIRGTQNVTPGSSSKKENRDVANVQVTDSAKKSHDADAVLVRFSVRFLPIENTFYAASSKDKDGLSAYRQSLIDFFKRAKTENTGLDEVSRRFARNILNGRWLWRNRLIACGVGITVKLGTGEIVVEGVDALGTSITDFDNYSQEEIKIGEHIANELRGESTQPLTVEARIDFGIPGEHEVFCSQNYLGAQTEKGFARSLYYVNAENTFLGVGVKTLGQAAFRDQKVSNAIRTIDTWYPDYKIIGRPIPVEPAGANLADDCFYREKEDTAFAIIKRLNEVDVNSPDGMFMIASLIRGGVYSESEKK